MCVWTITAPASKSINLDFSMVQLNGECDRNYVMVFDLAAGQGYDHPIITICGKPSHTPTAKSKGNKMSVKLNAQEAGARFQAEYDYGKCGGTQTGTSGTVTASEVNHDGKTFECETIIKGPKDHTINFTFAENFNVPCEKQGGEYVSGNYVKLVEHTKVFFFKNVLEYRYVSKSF